TIVALLAVNMWLFATSLGTDNALIAMNRPQASFLANVAGLVVTLFCAVVLVPVYSVTGGAWAALIGAAIAATLKAILFLIISRQSLAQETQRSAPQIPSGRCLSIERS